MPLDAGLFTADVASFGLHLAAENKAPGTVRTYTEAMLWFAAGYLLRETGKTRWEQVSGQDVQRWTVRLLARYSDSYASSQFRALQQFFRWLAAEDEVPDPMARLRPPRLAARPPQLRPHHGLLTRRAAAGCPASPAMNFPGSARPAGAAEVSLSDAVRNSLISAAVPERAAANILKQSSGAVEIFRLFVITGARPSISDSRVMDQLANPRNNVVHAGSASNSEEARRAIDTAALIVGAAAPLPDPAAAGRTARS
jgi:hypothetical protein